jgi:hypothetical protein
MNEVTARPAGTTAAISGAIVVILEHFGVDFTIAEATAIVAGLTAIVSFFYPLGEEIPEEE